MPWQDWSYVVSVVESSRYYIEGCRRIAEPLKVPTAHCMTETDSGTTAIILYLAANLDA